MPSRFFYFIVFILTLVINTLAAGVKAIPDETNPSEILGASTNHLQPKIFISRSIRNWHIEIDFIAHTNFANNTWLKIPNRVGSRLQLWLCERVEVVSKDPNVLAAKQLPVQTTVLDIMQNVRPRSRRGMQWLSTQSGVSFAATTFALGDAFGTPFTNDVVLQITPLIYRVDTNQVSARLIEFPPIKMKLLANGSVETLRGTPP